MLEGYLFAQNSLVPIFSRMDDDEINETVLINSIKQLHGFIGKTLLEITNDESGKYAVQQIIRWNPSTETDRLTYFTLHKMQHSSLNGKNPRTLLMELLTRELHLTKKEVIQFINLLERLKNDPNIKPRASQLQYINGDIATLTMEKLAVAYLTDLLTQDEKTLVSKIATICRDPADIPAAMEYFAKTTLAQWKSCDKQDLRAVSQFLSEMFYQLTDIHPFSNANGRTATCLVNVFLRSIGQPSILMRNPGERDLSSSSYSMAIEKINETRTPLANHIYQRILDTKISPFANAKLEETITLRCNVVRQLKILQAKNPTLDINNYQDTMNQFSWNPEIYTLSTLEDKVIFILKGMLNFLVREEQKLDQNAQIQSINRSFIPTTLTSPQKEQLKQDLFTLTQVNGWKVNPQNNLECWIEIPLMNEAEKVAAKLRESEVGNVLVSRRRDNQVPVIKCSNINLSVLKDKIIPISGTSLEVSSSSLR
ncbi:Fic/DOC family protein [Legionella massiliensis]|uniref:Fic/DOC family protein n=1 Tax=Legionella massiliensis TaxID=1034943 RepID=A0A078L2P3_9GAMM|nr:Fic family protein [Legionella massiliensis]CDZ79426.1 Fic/DOC family protein [Legionella massiliensis]CEE15164.1 Fic/DOC family protein [Legionella massiliensis]